MELFRHDKKPKRRCKDPESSGKAGSFNNANSTTSSRTMVSSFAKRAQRHGLHYSPALFYRVTQYARLKSWNKVTGTRGARVLAVTRYKVRADGRNFHRDGVTHALRVKRRRKLRASLERWNTARTSRSRRDSRLSRKYRSTCVLWRHVGSFAEGEITSLPPFSREYMHANTHTSIRRTYIIIRVGRQLG